MTPATAATGQQTVVKLVGDSGAPETAINLAATRLTEPFEGFVTHPYQDGGGVWTIGCGSTRDALGRPVCSTTPNVTLAEALSLLERDMRSALAVIEKDVHTPLSEPLEAALADFVYNVGQGNFEASTMLRKLNAGDTAGALAEFPKWDLIKGVQSPGLLRRRLAEVALATSHPV